MSDLYSCKTGLSNSKEEYSPTSEILQPIFLNIGSNLDQWQVKAERRNLSRIIVYWILGVIINYDDCGEMVEADDCKEITMGDGGKLTEIHNRLIKVDLLNSDQAETGRVDSNGKSEFPHALFLPSQRLIMLPSLYLWLESLQTVATAPMF